MTRCKQCHQEGHHKMSCTESRLKEPIIEGAYYEREDGQVVGPAARNGANLWKVGQWLYHAHGSISRTEYGTTECHMPLRWQDALCLTRRVYLVPTDPAEVVAELWARASACAPSGGVPTVAVDSDGRVMSLGVATVAHMLNAAADLVAQKLGVKP